MYNIYIYIKICCLIFRLPAVDQTSFESRDYQYEVKKIPHKGQGVKIFTQKSEKEVYINIPIYTCCLFLKICLMFEDKVDIRPS